MRAATHIRVGMVLLLVVQVCTSFAGVLLLARMSPAVERILGENVQSLEATEGMWRAVAAPSRTDFDDHLQAAAGNVTEVGEDAVIADLREHAPRAFSGEVAARFEILSALEQLGEVNREAMERKMREARHLGVAGAWVMVVLGLAGYASNIWVSRRYRVALLAPLLDLLGVVRSTLEGDRIRRCRANCEVAELRELSTGVNRLLDADAGHRTGPVRQGASTDRLALLALLDARSEAVVVLDGEGALVAANVAAQDRLSGAEGPAWKDAAAKADSDRVARVWDLPGGGRIVAFRDPPGAPAA